MSKRIALKVLRAQRELSQTALAQKAGVSLQTVSRVESGRPMEIETAVRLAKALGVGVMDAFPELDTHARAS